MVFGDEDRWHLHRVLEARGFHHSQFSCRIFHDLPSAAYKDPDTPVGPTCSLFLLATIAREGRGPAGSCDGRLIEQGSPTLATKLVHPPSQTAEGDDHQRGGRQQQGRLVKPTQARHGEEQNECG
jgi:hypothetical protein